MYRELKCFFVFVLCLGMITGCSSSNITPDRSEPATSDLDLQLTSADTTVVDAGTGSESAIGAEASAEASAATSAGTIDLNGDYSVRVSLSEAAMAVPECEAVVGVMNVTGTTITGIIDDRLIVSGTIATDGTITGGFAFDGDTSLFATYNGMLDGEELAGEWQDITGCAGAWRAMKIDAL